MFARYHDELSKPMSRYRGSRLAPKDIREMFHSEYPDLRHDFVQPSDHCSNHTCKGACTCAGTDRAIFKRLEGRQYLVL